MLADITFLAFQMKITVHKNHLSGQILYKSSELLKNGRFFNRTFVQNLTTIIYFSNFIFLYKIGHVKKSRSRENTKNISFAEYLFSIINSLVPFKLCRRQGVSYYIDAVF